MTVYEADHDTLTTLRADCPFPWCDETGVPAEAGHRPYGRGIGSARHRCPACGRRWLNLWRFPGEGAAPTDDGVLCLRIGPPDTWFADEPAATRTPRLAALEARLDTLTDRLAETEARLDALETALAATR